MNSDWRRKVLVTAGSKGLGVAIAKRLAQEGAHVVICGRDQSALERAAADLRNISQCEGAYGIVVDLSRRSEVDLLFERAVRLMGNVNCLVVNSGHMPYGTIETLSDEDWDASYEMLLMSAVRLSRAAARLMKTSDRARDMYSSRLRGCMRQQATCFCQMLCVPA